MELEVRPGGRDASGMHDPTPVGHLVLVGVFGVVVKVHRMNDSQVEQEFVQYLDQFGVPGGGNTKAIFRSIILANENYICIILSVCIL